MRRSTRKAYHEKVDSVLKREKQIKGIRSADSYLNSNSRDFWKEAELLRGRKRGPSAAVEGLTNGDDIANAFSRYIRYKIFISGINAHRLKIHIYYNN